MPYLGRAPTVANNVIGDLTVSGSILADGQISGGRINHKLALNGSDGGGSNEYDHFIFEDGGTDGSGTNAGANLLLEDVTPSQLEIPVARIAGAGTSGQFLQSQGTGIAPSFAAVTSAFSIIDSGTITSTDGTTGIEFTSMTHDIHILEIFSVETGSASAIELHFSADNGSSYLSAQYDNYFTQLYAKTGGTSAQGARYGADNTSDPGVGQMYTQGGNNNVELSLVGAAARTSSEQDPQSSGGSGSALITVTFDRNKDGTHIPYGHAICCWEPAGYAPAIGLTGFKCNLSAGNDIDAMKVMLATGIWDKFKYRLIGYSV